MVLVVVVVTVGERVKVEGKEEATEELGNENEADGIWGW